MDFLHGIEHLDVASDLVPVNDVVTAVIGLVGTSAADNVGQLILCRSAQDDTQFGTEGTIPESLKAIRMQDSAQGSALVLVINVAHPDDTITASTIIGEITSEGERTGLKLFDTAQPRFGFEPSIYIVPHYSALPAVVAELIAMTNKTETMAYIDAPAGMTVEQVIEARNGSGQFAQLNEGQKLLFPQFLVSNPDYNAEDPESNEYNTVPMSAYMAGLRAKVDLEKGWHYSSSNQTINGVAGMDVAITFGLSDKTCEANRLKAAGITPAVNMYGNGIVEWGNYTTGFPANTTPAALECVRRTRAIMKRSIGLASVQFIDRLHIRQADIDLVRNSVNQYLNRLSNEGKIIEGECFYRKQDNPTSELALGHVTFAIEFTPSIPMQRLTYTYKIDTENLANIQ